VGSWQDSRWLVYPYLSDPWLMTHGLQVWVNAGTGMGRLKITHGLPMPIPRYQRVTKNGNEALWDNGEIETTRKWTMGMLMTMRGECRQQ
jgi:hypothetical protein